VAAYGSTVFYEGWVAERMAEDFAEHGAYVTAADLADFEAETSIVVEGRFGELGLLGTYIPASGATSIEALPILDRVGLGEMDPDRRASTVGGAWRWRSRTAKPPGAIRGLPSWTRRGSCRRSSRRSGRER
jgi:gamma-glutamyltranspeptidase/glutathione hydrolase